MGIQTEISDSEALDPSIMALREHITKEMDKKTILDGISDMTKLVTGPLVAIGCSTLIASFATATEATAAILFPCGIGLLIAGGIALTTSIATSYYSTKINRATSFDRGELDRMRSAHHLVSAMRENQLCVTPEQEAHRAWTESVDQSNAKIQSHSL